MAAATARSLDEAEAVTLIEELLREAKQRPVLGWQVVLPSRSALEVDVRIGESDFGIEWVSAQDRSRYGDALPEPDPGGQLRLLSSAAPGAREPAWILLLDHESYRLAASIAHASVLEREQERALEHRLRRDLTDFLEYARSQYRL